MTITEPSADPWRQAETAGTYLAEKAGLRAGATVVVLGSGWAPVADTLGHAQLTIGYDEIPGFARPAVSGHVGEARVLVVGGRPVLVLLGRVHGYEGISPAVACHAVRSAVLAGCTTVVLTNAAGAVAPFATGELVAISDQINLTGQSPLAGPPPPEGRPSRFVDLAGLYSAQLRQAALSAGARHEGVYAGMLGPQYETSAETNMLRALGADVVGMSTVWEAIAARHLGADVAGLSLVTNAATGTSAAGASGATGASPAGTTHTEVLEVVRSRAGALGQVLGSMLKAIGQAKPPTISSQPLPPWQPPAQRDAPTGLTSTGLTSTGLTSTGLTSTGKPSWPAEPVPPAEPSWAELRQLATDVARRGYARYSGLQVGAAGRLDDGRTIVGCNVENASYGLTLCAECGLVAALHASGGGRLVQVSVVAADGRPLAPCGRCRQLLFEAGGAELELDGEQGPVRLGELLPNAFGPDDLERR